MRANIYEVSAWNFLYLLRVSELGVLIAEIVFRGVLE